MIPAILVIASIFYFTTFFDNNEQDLYRPKRLPSNTQEGFVQEEQSKDRSVNLMDRIERAIYDKLKTDGRKLK